MPRIPTSKPQDVRRQASTGGKVDTRTSSGFFKSISNASAEVGQIFEEARQERQKIEDLNAQNIQKIDQTSALAELNESILRSPSNTHKKLIDEWASKHSAAQSFPQASKEASEAFKRNQSLFVQNAISGAMVQSARKLQAEALQNAAAVQKNAVSNLDAEAAKQAWNNLLTGHEMVLKDQEIGREIEAEKQRRIDTAAKVIIEDAQNLVAANDDAGLENLISVVQNSGMEHPTLAKEMQTMLIGVQHQQINAAKTLTNKGSSGTLTSADLKAALEQNLISQSDYRDMQNSVALGPNIIDLAKKDPIFKSVQGTLDKIYGDYMSGEIDRSELPDASMVKKLTQNIDSLSVDPSAKLFLASRLAEISAAKKTDYNPDGWFPGSNPKLNAEQISTMQRLAGAYAKLAFGPSAGLSESDYQSGEVTSAMTEMQFHLDAAASAIQDGSLKVGDLSVQQFLEEKASQSATRFWKLSLENTLSE